MMLTIAKEAALMLNMISVIYLKGKVGNNYLGAIGD